MNHRPAFCQYSCDRDRSIDPGRRGIATLWVIVAVPVVITLIVVLTDVANVWLARVELKNALDAAALSGVKTWATSGSTSAGRGAAFETAHANTVLGNSVVLGLNTGARANNNGSPDGDILLGSITGGTTNLSFNCDGSANCVTGAISVDFAVDTSPIAPDTANADTFTRIYSYRVESFTGPVGSSLDSITINLATQVTTGSGTQDPAFFDFRNNPPSSDNQAGMDCVTLSAIPATCPIASGFSTGGAAVSASNAVTDGTQSSLTVFFTGLNPGDTIGFGADTDFVGPEKNDNGTDPVDNGGEFGSGYVDPNAAGNTTVTGAAVTVVISGQTFGPVILTFENTERSTATISGALTGGDAFGVRAKKTIQINSVSSMFPGTVLGPYDVTAESFARFACPTGPPQLVRIKSFICP